MMLRIRMVFWTALLLVRSTVGMATDESVLPASALRPINDFDWTQMPIKVVDPDGKAIAGAQIRFTALGADGGYGWWNDSLHGIPPIAITDDNGLASVFLPNTIHPLEKHLVKSGTFEVKHPDFCANSAHLDFQRNEVVPEVPLQHGIRLRIAGVLPGTEQPLPHCHALLEGNDAGGAEFFSDKKGWLNSVTISPTRRWFRVVYRPPGEPIQFSRLQSWDPARERQEYRVDVQPGVRVVGKMPDTIPRPISRGRIVVCSGSVPRGDDGDGQAKSTPVWWDDIATIQPDGRFEFPSLPAGHVAQVFAYADDWVSAQPSDEAFESLCKWYPDDGRKNRPGWFRFGQVLRLVGKSQLLELKMEQAGTVKVHCMDANQQPVQGIVVSFWPNQIVMGGRGGIFCEYNSTLDRLAGRQAWDAFRSNPFRGESDSAGIAIVRSVPADNQSIHVGTELWTSRTDLWGTDENRKQDQLNIPPGEIVERSFVLKRLN